MAIIGTLNGLNIKDDLLELNIGDMIPCEYLSSGSKVGTFKNLGNATKPLLSTATLDSPDGTFYFIHTGYDHLGRMKLIADRNIQHTISWDSLNGAGVVTESLINIFKTFKPTILGALTAHTQTGTGLLDDLGTNEWNTNNVFYWSTAGNYLELDIPHKCDIWRRGTTTWDYKGKLTILQWNGSTYIDVTSQYEQTYSTVTEKGAQRFLKGLDAGRYKFQFLAETRLDSEWIFYNVDDASLSDFNISTRLLTGGISETDTDNEWDKIIVNSTLNGVITAGNNAIWNWSGLFTWTSTTSAAIASRVSRGNSAANTHLYKTATVSDNTVAYRPMLLVELLNDPPLISNIDLTHTHIWHADTDNITLSFSITDKELDQIQYTLLMNDIEIVPLSEMTTVPVDIVLPISKLTCTNKINNLSLIVTDKFGNESVFSYNIRKEDINDLTFNRTFNFNAQWTPREAGTIIENDQLKLISNSSIVTTSTNTQINTSNRSNILGVIIDGDIDTEVQFDINTDMTVSETFEDGNIYETNLDLSVYKDILSFEVTPK